MVGRAEMRRHENTARQEKVIGSLTYRSGFLGRKATLSHIFDLFVIVLESGNCNRPVRTIDYSAKTSYLTVSMVVNRRPFGTSEVARQINIVPRKI
jgi:hypothetical protein